MKTTKSKIGNPALLATAASKASNNEATKQAASTIPFLIKTTVVVVGGVILYRFVTTRFKKMPEVSNFPAANITVTQAKAKADSIYKAANIFYSDFETIKNQFSGVNYNGIVRIYNAFGQVGNMVTGYSDMNQFLNSRLSTTDILQLRFLTSGAFFKSNEPVKSEYGQTIDFTEINEPKPLPQNQVKLIQFSGV